MSAKAQARARSRRQDGPRARTRRRGAALEDAVLRAAWDELRAVAYADLTMEGVAARAKTSKAVLYRRWRTRAELVISAIRHRAPMYSGEVPDTGSLRGDVLALLRRVSRGANELGQDTIAGLMAEAAEDPDRPSFLQGRHAGIDAMTVILARAQQRGEVRPGPIPRRAISVPVDLLRHDLLVTRSPLPRGALEQIVDDVFLPLVTALS